MESSTTVVARRDLIDELREMISPRFRLLNTTLSDTTRTCGVSD